MGVQKTSIRKLETPTEVRPHQHGSQVRPPKPNPDQARQFANRSQPGPKRHAHRRLSPLRSLPCRQSAQPLSLAPATDSPKQAGHPGQADTTGCDSGGARDPRVARLVGRRAYWLAVSRARKAVGGGESVSSAMTIGWGARWIAGGTTARHHELRALGSGRVAVILGFGVLALVAVFVTISSSWSAIDNVEISDVWYRHGIVLASE